MKDLYGYAEGLERAKRRLSKYGNADLLLGFIGHLEALGLSAGRIVKYANHLCTIFRNVPFDPSSASKADVEKVIAWINSQPYKEWTKHDLKLTVRKIVQYAKMGSCDRKTPIPPEVSWFSLKVDEKDSRVSKSTFRTPILVTNRLHLGQ